MTLPATALPACTALIADDERLMREQLREALKVVWPSLKILGEARHGLEAVERVQSLQPDIAFLDIRMPGMSGIEVAQALAQQAAAGGPALPALVFVTAYDQHAVDAFEQGAVDYILKPAQTDRLSRSAQRLAQRLVPPQTSPGAPQQTLTLAASSLSPEALQALLDQLAQRLNAPRPPYLQRIQASQGQTLKLIPVGDILFFHSDEKYTLVRTRESECLIRKPIRELAAELDPQQFWQIHRATLVNAQAIEQVVRDDRGLLVLTLRGCPDRLTVSRSHAGLFKGM